MGAKKSELGREENHLVKATLIVNDTKISGVPCKIYLPERIHEKPYLILKPSKDDATSLMVSHKGALQANVVGFNNEIQISFEAPEVYFSGSFTKYWGDDISDNTIPGEPQDLHLIQYFKADESPEKTRIVFWVSANPVLTPFMSQISSYTGDLEYKRALNVEFTLTDKIKLVFDKHFRSKTAKNGDFIQWSFLVACAEIDSPAADAETIKKEVLPDIDDFLLIASFAARQRTACLGWAASDQKSQTTFYRGNYVFPHVDRDVDRNDTLIDISNIERFMQTCYPIFLQYENKLALRNALNSIVPSQFSVLEVSFLNMFAGLETLILDFRRRESHEFVLPENNWAVLKTYLQKCIKQSTEPKLKKQERNSMYCKLEELNRVSLREAFDLFCNNHSIYLADLWPVFKENGQVGLADIRNRIIHGDPFHHDMMYPYPLIIANEHLKYVLERVLLRVLQWSLQETKVNPAYLQMNTLTIKDMLSERAKLSEYIC
ncbi:hypothetical protein ABXJ76_14785 [Methylobacter sp. G7]|uniref:hypothetical protein n=1 Tax=Methylobacter sp. G7 TaxID=3230117 RepID=UPI003D807CBF